MKNVQSYIKHNTDFLNKCQPEICENTKITNESFQTEAINFNLSNQAKKKSCFRESAGRKCFDHSPACIVECVPEHYRFLVSKKLQKKTKKNKKTKSKRN